MEGHGDGEPSPAVLKVKDTTEKETDEPENSEPVHTTANGNAKPTQKKEKGKEFMRVKGQQKYSCKVYYDMLNLSAISLESII